MQNWPQIPENDYFAVSLSAATIMLASAVVRITPESQPLGMPAQIASMGYSVRIGSVGFNSHIGSSGARARVAVTGNSSRISSAGDSGRIANTGMRVRVCTLVNGVMSPVMVTGKSPALAQTPELPTAATMYISLPAVKFNGSEHGRGRLNYSGRGCAALAYHDGERVRFAVAIEGENNIRAGVRYRLNEQHQFVEC